MYWRSKTWRNWKDSGLTGRSGVALKYHIVIALCILTLLPDVPHAFAEQGAPVKVTVITRAPQPAKWIMNVAADGTGRIFKCKPQACSAPEFVSFTFRTGSPRHLDPKALQTFAAVELPKSIRAAAVARTVMTGIVERIETLSSKATTLKNYPSAVNETKFTRSSVKTVFLDTGVIFAGPLMIRVESTSPDRSLARKSFDDFIDAMQIVETPVPPQKRPFPYTKTESL